MTHVLGRWCKYMSRRNRNYEEMINQTYKEVTSPIQRETQEDGHSKPPIRNGEVINSRIVNVRESPSSSAPVIQILDRGDVVKILDKVGEYYKIKIKDDGRIGYIFLDFCKEVP